MASRGWRKNRGMIKFVADFDVSICSCLVHAPVIETFGRAGCRTYEG